MSRILRRPMFRGGRVERRGGGISQLRPGYAPGGEVEDYMEILKAVRESRPELPEKKGMSTADYLRIASAGADIMAAPSEGGGIGGALRSAAPALSDLGTDMAASLDARTAARADLLANEETAITDIASAIMKSRNYRPDRGFNVDRTMAIIEENYKIVQDIDAILASDESFVKYLQENKIEAKTVEQIADEKQKLKNKKEIAKAKLADILPKNENMNAFLKTPQAQIIFSGVIKAEEERQGKLKNDPEFDMNALIMAINRIGQKDGGLTTGYANGGLTAAMSEEVITPQGGEIMEEEVVEETPAAGSSAPLTFEQLRQRLPQEIPDDVIRLLASSDEALLEFSNIATQQDVDEFNVKYGVELVLPQV